MKSKQLGWVFFVLAIVGMSVGVVHAQAVVARYSFENADNLGKDSSTAGNDAAVVGSPVQSAGQFGGNGIQLDGTSSISFRDYLQLPDISSHFGGQQGTLALWMNLNLFPPDPSQSGWVYMGDSGDPGDEDDTHYPWRDGRAYLNALRNDRQSVHISSERPLDSEDPPPCPTCLTDAELMEWHHVAITSDANDWKVYQNGNLIYQADGSWSLPTAPKVGQGRVDNGESFDGLMDEVWIVNVALNETQVNRLYTENMIPEPSSLVILLGGLAALATGRSRRRRG